MLYEIYEVPNGELDGSEEFIDSFIDKELANNEFDYLSNTYSNLWLIICSDARGYEKVIRT